MVWQPPHFSENVCAPAPATVVVGTLTPSLPQPDAVAATTKSASTSKDRVRLNIGGGNTRPKTECWFNYTPNDGLGRNQAFQKRDRSVRHRRLRGDFVLRERPDRHDR